MKFKAPHWLTSILALVALIAGSLAKTDTFPSLTPLFSVIAVGALALTTPTIVTGSAALVLVVCLGSTGCAWFASHPAVTTDAQGLLSCVVGELSQDALKGDSAITIGFDVAIACGKDAESVLEAALASQQVAANAKSKGALVLASRRK